METSNKGRRKRVKVVNQQEEASTSPSTSRTNKDDENLMMEVDSSFLDSYAAANKALGVSLILQCIVSKLNLPNLKSARLVNKTWKEETDKEIMRRDCLRLKFNPESRRLNVGLKDLEFSSDLPCFDFHLSVLKDIKMKEIKLFLSLFGSRVKSLSLNSRINENALCTLLNGLENLESLFLVNGFLEHGVQFYAHTSKFKIKGDLINLKHLTFAPLVAHECKETLEIPVGSCVLEIISKAPKLQSINNAVFDQNLLLCDSSKWREKVDLLKSFKCLRARLNFYLGLQVKLETLLLCSNSYEKEVVRDIVKSSQDTLRTLVVDSTFICLPQKDGFGPLFLPFGNLKVLQICFDEFMWNNLVDANFTSKQPAQFKQEAFPNLSTVVIELSGRRFYSEQIRGLEYSPFANPIESVVNLELRAWGNGASYWKINEFRIRRIKELFPKVKQLKLKNSFKIPPILPSCFAHWPELESLEFHINFMRQQDMREPTKNFYFEAMKLSKNLDWVFTGLPLKMCERLRKSEPGEILEKDIRVAQDINSNERSRNSLVFLKELKKLNIVFSDIRPGISETECPISPVSCLYAFKLMPKLKVRILYDQNLAKFDPETRTFEDEYNMEKYLEQLAPHCEIGHWENGGVASLISPEFSFGFGLMTVGYRMPMYF